MKKRLYITMNRELLFNITNIELDKNTGELFLNKEKTKQELDEYQVIVTSEPDESNNHIIEMHRELWRIEESFKILQEEITLMLIC